MQERSVEFIKTTIKSGRSILKKLATSDSHDYYLNPCMFLNHQETATIEEFGSITLIGSGDSNQCIELIAEILWPGEAEKCRDEKKCAIDGIIPPPIEDMHFFGMVWLHVLCLYFNIL